MIARMAVLLAMLISLTGSSSPSSRADQVVFGSDFTLPAGQRMEGNVMVIGGSAHVEAGAELAGDLTVMMGSARIEGRVEGDVTVLGPRVRLDPTARIRGDLVVLGGTLEQEPGAVVEGRILLGPRWILGGSPFPVFPFPLSGLFRLADQAARALLGGVVLALLTLVGVSFFQGAIDQNARTLQRAPAVSLGTGCLALPLGGILILLLAITLVGLPLALIVLALLIGAFLFGWISVGHLIGLQLRGNIPSGWPPVAVTITGVLLLWLLWVLADFLPLCGGPILRLILAALAVGSTLLSRFGMRSYPPSSAEVAGPSEGPGEGLERSGSPSGSPASPPGTMPLEG